MASNSKKFNRALRTISVFAKYGFENIVSSHNFKKWIPQKLLGKNEKIDQLLSYSVYQRIRMALEDLGPSYIKLGQLFSDRDDILPADLISELKKLQNDVGAKTIDVKKKLEDELGMVPENHFCFIADEPFASASISQVFRAELKDGTEVALKIKREQIEEIIAADLLIMKDVAKILENHSEEIKAFNPTQLVNVFEKSIHRELSFLQEQQNIEHFARNFKEDERIYCHAVYNGFSNNNILCMEYVEGIKITDIERLFGAGLNPQKLALTGFDLYMRQVLDHGYFHADPHPGNILVTNEGKIAFIDFGTMGVLIPPDKEHLEDFLRYMVQKNAKGIVATIKKMAINQSLGSERELERDIYQIFDIMEQSSLRTLNISMVIGRLKSIFQKNVIVFPEYVYLLMKGLVQIEGIGKKLDPNLNFYDILKPYAMRIIKKRLSPRYRFREGLRNLGQLSAILGSIPGEVLDLVQKVKDGDLRISHRVEGIPELKTAVDRLVLGLIISALSIGSSILVLANMPPKVFGIPLLGLVGFMVSLILGLWIMASMMRKKQY